MGHTPKTVGYEFLQDTLSRWAENLWMTNNKARITDDASRNKVHTEFWDRLYPDNNRGLTRLQSFSEQSFTGLCYGVVLTVGRVSDKATDALMDNRLVDAWRHSVHRNGFQQKYTLLEEILKETLDNHGGAKAAIAALPKYSTVTGSDFAEALETMGYKSKLLDPRAITDLLRRADGAEKKPVAPSPKTP